ncbi:MAG: FecR domain-containing protein [Niastella sp.]|nr:FecR domain-containing protein [Niastella sp.]
MKRQLQDLILIYYKRKDGQSLTEVEQAIWDQYRKERPANEKVDEELVEIFAFHQQRMQQWEQFREKYKIQVELQQKAVGITKSLSIIVSLLIAASMVMAMGLWWLFIDTPAQTTAAVPEWKTLRTPKGKQERLVLADGSTVSLNAASVLRYPLHFEKGKREVILEEGEAYFEITHKRGEIFTVYCKGEAVEVRGTSFDLSSYDTATIITTLVEGSVRIKLPGRTLLLQPGQQAIVDKQGGISSSAVDTKDVIAWKKGYFSFHNTRLSVIMKELARWYDVEFIFLDPLNDMPFTIVDYPRNEPLEGLLKDMAASRLVFFELNGRKVYIRKGL